MQDNICVCCGRTIPEGWHICLLCEGENEVQHFRPQIPPIRTNGDKIRAMSDSELANMLSSIIWICNYFDSCEKCPLAETENCRADGVKQWLKQEVNEDD